MGFSLKDPAGPDVVRFAATDFVRLAATGSVRFAATDFSSTGQRYSIADAGSPFLIRFPLNRSYVFGLQNRSTELQICAASKNLVARIELEVACLLLPREPTAGRHIACMRIRIKEILGRRAGTSLMEGYSLAPAVPPRVGARKTIDHNRQFTNRADAVFARNSSLTDFAETVDAE